MGAFASIFRTRFGEWEFPVSGSSGSTDKNYSIASPAESIMQTLKTLEG
jgi:hypothetical protein